MKKQLLLSMALLATTTASASNTGIRPLGFTLPPTQSNDVITLSNPTDRIQKFQGMSYEWHQESGNEIHTPTRSLVVYPPVVTIAPHSDVPVRIVHRAPDPSKEKAYRVVLMELPSPDDAQLTGTQGVVKMSYSLPVFFRPQTAQPQLSSKCLTPQKLEVSNTGSATAKISGGPLGGLVGYVQPQSTMVFELPCPGPQSFVVNDKPQSL